MEKKLIIIAASVVALLIIYFIASPYQNCKRGYAKSTNMKPHLIEQDCHTLTSW